jgi:hypothetical protein
VLGECDIDCGTDLPACTDTYTSEDITGYIDCGESPATCAFEFNSESHTCNEVCEDAGGECVGAWNDYLTCGYGDWLGCNGDWYSSAMCVCSRGCGSDDPCPSTQTCEDGECI